MRPSPSAVWFAAAIMLALPPAARSTVAREGVPPGLENIRAGVAVEPAGLENIRAGQPAEGPGLAAAAEEGWAAPRAAEAAVAPRAEVAPQEVVPADDAYHYPAWKDGRYDALYTEWWYFNFHDARAGVD